MSRLLAFLVASAFCLAAVGAQSAPPSYVQWSGTNCSSANATGVQFPAMRLLGFEVDMGAEITEFSLITFTSTEAPVEVTKLTGSIPYMLYNLVQSKTSSTVYYGSHAKAGIDYSNFIRITVNQAATQIESVEDLGKANGVADGYYFTFAFETEDTVIGTYLTNSGDFSIHRINLTTLEATSVMDLDFTSFITESINFFGDKLLLHNVPNANYQAVDVVAVDLASSTAELTGWAADTCDFALGAAKIQGSVVYPVSSGGRARCMGASGWYYTVGMNMVYGVPATLVIAMVNPANGYTLMVGTSEVDGFDAIQYVAPAPLLEDCVDLGDADACYASASPCWWNGTGCQAAPVTQAQAQSDGSADLPHCSFSSTCTWDDETKLECAQRLCEAAGFVTGTFVSASNDMCSTDFTGDEVWAWKTDEGAYYQGNDIQVAQILADCQCQVTSTTMTTSTTTSTTSATSFTSTTTTTSTSATMTTSTTTSTTSTTSFTSTTTSSSSTTTTTSTSSSTSSTSSSTTTTTSSTTSTSLTTTSTTSSTSTMTTTTTTTSTSTTMTTSTTTSTTSTTSFTSTTTSSSSTTTTTSTLSSTSSTSSSATTTTSSTISTSSMTTSTTSSTSMTTTTSTATRTSSTTSTTSSSGTTTTSSTTSGTTTTSSTTSASTTTTDTTTSTTTVEYITYSGDLIMDFGEDAEALANEISSNATFAQAIEKSIADVVPGVDADMVTVTGATVRSAGSGRRLEAGLRQAHRGLQEAQEVIVSYEIDVPVDEETGEPEVVLDVNEDSLVGVTNVMASFGYTVVNTRVTNPLIDPLIATTTSTVLTTEGEDEDQFPVNLVLGFGAMLTVVGGILVFSRFFKKSNQDRSAAAAPADSGKGGGASPAVAPQEPVEATEDVNVCIVENTPEEGEGVVANALTDAGVYCYEDRSEHEEAM